MDKSFGEWSVGWFAARRRLKWLKVETAFVMFYSHRMSPCHVLDLHSICIANKQGSTMRGLHITAKLAIEAGLNPKDAQLILTSSPFQWPLLKQTHHEPLSNNSRTARKGILYQTNSYKFKHRLATCGSLVHWDFFLSRLKLARSLTHRMHSHSSSPPPTLHSPLPKRLFQHPFSRSLIPSPREVDVFQW